MRDKIKAYFDDPQRKEWIKICVISMMLPIFLIIISLIFAALNHFFPGQGTPVTECLDAAKNFAVIGALLFMIMMIAAI